MLYSYRNVMPGTSVYEVATKAKIGDVVEVNTQAGWLKVTDHPARDNGHGHIATRRIRFDVIHAIFGGSQKPCLFHCYGRKA